MANTREQYDKVIELCSDLFIKKMQDYGSAWRILRTSSLTDQIYIKAQRIRSIQEIGEQKIEDGIYSEFIGIVNYSVMALIQLDIGVGSADDMAKTKVADLFTSHFNASKNLMLDKNHDYGEAWRNMRISSFTDIILMKLHRIKQIEDNEGNTIVSEGLEANFSDIVNYAVFALIMMNEQK